VEVDRHVEKRPAQPAPLVYLPGHFQHGWCFADTLHPPVSEIGTQHSTDLVKLLRRVSFGAGRGNGLGLALLLLVVVLVPSVCLVWFMKQAVTNERLAGRQRLAEAYRGYLSLAQERLAAYWRASAGELDAQTGSLLPSALFAKQANAGVADAVICFDASGKVAYPSTCAAPPPAAKTPDWAEAERLEADDPAAAAKSFARLAEHAESADQAARALQSQARCLFRAGDKQGAIAVLLGPLAEERFQNAVDAQGRLLVPNAELMALELVKEVSPERVGPPLERLRKRVEDYNDPLMSAPQRRFLMQELQRLFPERVKFPTLAAEELAARYVEAGAVGPGDPRLETTSLQGVWRVTSNDRRLVLLHETDHLLVRMRATAASEPLPADVNLTFLPPGHEPENAALAVAAGTDLPGWRLALSLGGGPGSNATADQRIAIYTWIGVLVVAAVIILGFLALRLVRRQAAVTQLRNDLVANVTHELKTPLSSMRLLVDTLLNSEKLHEATAREYLQLIARENARLSRLIDNFLAFSRMERNKRAFDFRGVPTETIVDGAAATVRERFHTPGCQFEVNVPPNLPVVTADADAMVTALVNLLDNAYKYSGDDKRIRLSAAAQNGKVRFAVEDNGIGLAPRETKRVFKRFYQVDQRMSRSGGGCGLGLSIVKFIVSAHHGTVEVESLPNRGSTFTISIPAANANR
jgi:signal transduction histidine kinase